MLDLMSIELLMYEFTTMTPLWAIGHWRKAPVQAHPVENKSVTWLVSWVNIQILQHNGLQPIRILCFMHKFSCIFVVVQNDQVLIENPNIHDIT